MKITKDVKDTGIFPGIFIVLIIALIAVVMPLGNDDSFASDTPLLMARADLTEYNIEDLMDMTVTSVSKKSQRIADAAAAVYVITQDDIHRSGVTTIPDALKMAPGISVARIDSNKWAVTSRGFNGRFSNKLLVLMDGRSLYNTFYLGVYWDIQDTVLEDIDRIEVIRGPGASLWGSNAVNGVINIITKSAGKSDGTLVSAGGGNYEKAFITARQGLNIGDGIDLRIYGKHQQKNGFKDSAGNETYDEWHTTRGGFRLDAQLTQQNSFTIQGDYYDGKIQETYVLFNPPSSPPPPMYKYLSRSQTGNSGGNLLARFQRALSPTDNISLQTYYDYSEYGMVICPEVFNTLDVDLQHQFSLGSHQNIVWGAGYRYSEYRVQNSYTLSFKEQQVGNNLYSSFIHDEITLVPNSLALIVGSRFEESDHSGFDAQPNGRLLWTITPHNSLWTSVSRAVRTRTRSEQIIQYNYRTLPPNTAPNTAPIPLRLEIVGNNDFKSEDIMAYEIGYRTEPARHLSIDVAGFYNDYKRLRVISPGTAYLEPAGNAVQPFYLSNDMHGHSVGIELSTDWRPYDWWHLQGTYSYQKFTMYLDGTSTDTINKGNAEGDVPQNQFSLRSGFDLGREINLDLWLRGVDHLASIDGEKIPGFLTMDARIAWRPIKGLELSLVGQNLFDGHRPEFIPEYVNTVPTENVRSYYAKATWRF